MYIMLYTKDVEELVELYNKYSKHIEEVYAAFKDMVVVPSTSSV